MTDAAPSQSISPSTNGIAIWFVDLKQCGEALDAAERRLSRLSAAERERYQSRLSHSREDAELWRAAHIALRLVLERYAGLSVREMAYDIEPGGRPRLKNSNGSTGLPYFSLAHAGQYALIAISSTGPIGADLEMTREIKLSKVRRARVEQTAADAAPGAALPEEPVARFLQSWVRLEAIAKASGLGIGRLLTGAGVVGGQPLTRVHATTSSATVRDLELKAGCFAAIAGGGLPRVLTVEDFPLGTAALQAFLASGNGH